MHRSHQLTDLDVDAADREPGEPAEPAEGLEARAPGEEEPDGDDRRRRRLSPV